MTDKLMDDHEAYRTMYCYKCKEWSMPREAKYDREFELYDCPRCGIPLH